MSTRHIRDAPSVPVYPDLPLQEATIATTPATDGDTVDVLIASGARTQRVATVAWTPRPTATGVQLPARGDRCLIARAETGYWIVCWRPA